MEARRHILQSLKPTESTHAGLWMDRFLEEQTTAKNDKTPDEKKDSQPDAAESVAGQRAKLIQQLGKIRVPIGYKAAFRLRELDFERLKSAQHGACTIAETTGRLIIGIGQKTPLEVGLHLDHTWGVPVLPGSALKGLCSATAHLLLADQQWRKPKPSVDGAPTTSREWLFGTVKHIGHVVFHDAWWCPLPEAQTLPIHQDVMTVHHPDYYQGKRVSKDPGADIVPPSDMDSPNPISFASVTGKFLIAIEGEPEWCEAALGILKIGLRELGLGAKTNAGYGRMKLDFVSEAERQADETARGQAAAAKEVERQQRQNEADAAVLPNVIKRLSLGSAANTVPDWLGRLRGPLRQQFAQRAIEQLTSKALKGRTDKWAIDLLAAAAAPAQGKD